MIPKLRPTMNLPDSELHNPQVEHDCPEPSISFKGPRPSLSEREINYCTTVDHGLDEDQHRVAEEHRCAQVSHHEQNTRTADSTHQMNEVSLHKPAEKVAQRSTSARQGPQPRRNGRPQKEVTIERRKDRPASRPWDIQLHPQYRLDSREEGHWWLLATVSLMHVAAIRPCQSEKQRYPN